MPIPVDCPSCNKRYYVRDALAGRETNCPKCYRPLRVPAPEDEDWAYLSAAQMGLDESLGDPTREALGSAGSGAARLGGSPGADFGSEPVLPAVRPSLWASLSLWTVRRAILWGLLGGFALGSGLTLLLYRPG